MYYEDILLRMPHMQGNMVLTKTYIHCQRQNLFLLSQGEGKNREIYPVTSELFTGSFEQYAYKLVPAASLIVNLETTALSALINLANEGE